ncbi:MAG: lamin tail domain-containing protein [Polyangiaceae bacterium]|nr:lamin tail domain-containing protein [Polyangiaceae bacterium]
MRRFIALALLSPSLLIACGGEDAESNSCAGSDCAGSGGLASGGSAGNGGNAGAATGGNAGAATGGSAGAATGGNAGSATGGSGGAAGGAGGTSGGSAGSGGTTAGAGGTAGSGGTAGAGGTTGGAGGTTGGAAGTSAGGTGGTTAGGTGGTGGTTGGTGGTSTGGAGGTAGNSGCTSCGPVSALRISEVLYDAPNGDTDREWIELYNSGSQPVDLAEATLGYGGTTLRSTTLDLPSLIIGPGACVVIGGPDASTDIGSPVYDVTLNLGGLQNATSNTADGVALFVGPASGLSASSLPFDVVIYGASNSNNLPGSDGSVPAQGYVAASAAGESLYSSLSTPAATAWGIASVPSPGRCFGLVASDLSNGDSQIFSGRRRGPETGGQALGLRTFNATASNTTVLFGTQTASCSDDAQGLSCVVPAGSGTVDLTLRQATGDVVYPGFYSYESIDYCIIQFPKDHTGAVGSTNTFYGRVYESGVTEAAGDSGALEVEWGYGPLGVDPGLAPSTFTWLSAAFNVQAGNDDEYAVDVTLPGPADVYAHVFRVRPNGGSDWTYCDRDGTVNNDPNGTNFFDINQVGLLETQ